MRIAVDLYHPADVHFFKNCIRLLKSQGHEILVTASSKDVSLDLLNNYKIRYINLGTYGNSILKKIMNIPLLDLKMYITLKEFNPDLLLGFGSIRASHVSKMLGKPCIIFEDTEHSVEQNLLYLPFCNVVCTPECFKKNMGSKQIKYNGYKELAYLHPNYFVPDPSVLEELGLSKTDLFIIVRLVSWNATHDIGESGIKDIYKLLQILEKHGQIFISSEGNLNKDLEKYRLTITPDKLHSLLYFATLYFGEGSTLATESALLGTPSIYVSSLSSKLGYILELEEKYDLLYSFTDQNKALNKALELLQNVNLKEDWQKKKNLLLCDKIDVTAFMVKFIEQYK